MAELLNGELMGDTLRVWHKLDSEKRDKISTALKSKFLFVAKFEGNKILFKSNGLFDDEYNEIRELEGFLLGKINDFIVDERVRGLSIKYRKRPETIQGLIGKTVNYAEKFGTLSFGSDVAEQDDNLLQYFVETPVYERVATSRTGIVIGPKGSGKSSILKALQAHAASGQAIVITPEIFATSMLRRIVEDGRDAWEEDRAFSATWEFTILFEVFKHIKDNPRGIPQPAVSDIKRFLSTYSDYAEADVFSRFVMYLQRIQSVKVAGIEISVKTRQLQELFSLEPLYDLVLRVRKHLRKPFLIMLDELDQGWDNSEHANKFLAGLLQAAVRIQNLGIQAHVIVFVRSEIFDLVRTRLSQLDKIRASMERLRWSDGEIMTLIAKRISNQFGSNWNVYEPRELLLALFDSVGTVSGFDYMISRTTRRPREILQITRLAHRYAVEANKLSVTAESIRRAEEEFSTWKLEHVCSEYLHIYPGLEFLLRKFRSSQARIPRDKLEDIIDSFRDGDQHSSVWLDGPVGNILEILYQVEFIGVARDSRTSHPIRELSEFEFAYETPSPNLNSHSEFLVHPAFWKGIEIIS